MLDEMNGEKDCTAFRAFRRVNLPDRNIGMLSQKIFKALKITTDPAGFVNLKFFGNIFSWPHTYRPWHVESPGSKKSAVYIGIQGSFRFHELIGMVYRDMVKGLSLYEKRRHHIVELFEFRFGKSETGPGFASEQLVFFLGVIGYVKAFFQRTPGTLLTAVADVGRFGKVKANIFFIRKT